MQNRDKIFGVYEYIELLNVALEAEEVKIIGEISQIKKATSGHVYFSLKDAGGTAVIDGIIWKGVYAKLGYDIEIGMQIIANGHPQVYAPTGRFSFITSYLTLSGEGTLKKAYELLKNKLEREGAFSIERKKILEELPQRIGVISSKEGAVIHDFLNNLGNFGFEIIFMDSRVEGSQAVPSLIEAVEIMQSEKIDALVIIRGGGSLESLQAFNNELLIKKILDFKVPVIAGIGHDADIPLLALVSDYMTSTPTAAAHLLNRSWEMARAKFDQIPYLFSLFNDALQLSKNKLDSVKENLFQLMSHNISIIEQKILFTNNIIKLNDPRNQLRLAP